MKYCQTWVCILEDMFREKKYSFYLLEIDNTVSKINIYHCSLNSTSLMMAPELVPKKYNFLYLEKRKTVVRFIMLIVFFYDFTFQYLWNQSLFPAAQPDNRC